MGARRVDWSMPPSQRSAPRRPSWLAAPLAPPPRSEGRPNLTLIPSVKPPPRVSLPPEPEVVSEPQPYPRMLEERDEQITVLTGLLEMAKATSGKLAAQLATHRRRTLEASENELVKLALVIAERVVGDAVAADPSLLVKWAKQAISMLPAKETIVVAVSPDLAECVPEAAWAMATEGEHRLEVDKSLPPNTCEVREGATSIEVSAAARLAAVGEAIGAIS